MRGDMLCFHEPFGEPWYHGEIPLWPRWTPETLRTPGLTFESVWDELRSAAKQGSVFSKDFPHYIKHIWSDSLLNNFNHSFLVRDPAKVATSMYKHWPEFVLGEMAFVEQRQLFDRLADQAGESPPVVDSDDLLEDPYGVVESYCNAVNIPFIPDALSWEAGSREEVSWYDGGSWHGNLRNSTGLEAQPRQYIDIDSAPDRVKEIYEACLPHYEHLHQYRLTAV